MSVHIINSYSCTLLVLLLNYFFHEFPEKDETRLSVGGIRLHSNRLLLINMILTHPLNDKLSHRREREREIHNIDLQPTSTHVLCMYVQEFKLMDGFVWVTSWSSDNYTRTVEPLFNGHLRKKDIGTVSEVPIANSMYKSTSEVRTPL